MPILDLLTPRAHDLGGGMVVKRVLPSAKKQAVGPFIFFDHFGPVQVTPQSQHDVRPHPHIGLATVTYLFDGAMMHRDSMGVTQRIEPGALNWMTAGRGVVHSERRPEDLRETSYINHGLQLWVALPTADEEIEPSFQHIPAADIPQWQGDGITARILVGTAFGLQSPVQTLQEMLYLDVQAEANSSFTLPASDLELALYSPEQIIIVDGVALEPGVMALLQPQVATTISIVQSARFVVLGGSKLDGHRHIWWNFVSSRKERIEQAKLAWAAQEMGTVPGEQEWIPLP
ncbi:MAG: pirin family protein [Burkholderiales bacterium]|nr:pirin family protein [Burkholderiales bacterium]